MKFLSHFSILFTNRNYGLLFSGQFISFIGTMITGVVLPYQIYHQTHSVLMVGLLGFFQLIPLLFTALIGGAMADRYHRRLLLLVTETLLGLGCILLAINSQLAEPHIWIIFLVAVFMSGITGLHRPALDSITQQLVKPGDYAAVGALSMLKYSIATIAGPALGGLIIAHFGVTVTFLVDFASFLLSLIALLCMRNIPKPSSQKDESTFAAIKSGFRYALSRQELLGTYFVDFFAMIFGMPTALFPAIAEHFGGATALGWLYAAPAIGALVISLSGDWPKKIKRHGAAIAYAAVLWGISIICFGLANVLWLAIFFLILSGMFDGISGIFRTIVWNETIPNEYRGRLSGIEMISYLSGPRLGDTEAGLVAAAIGVSGSVVAGGVLCVISVVLCCYYLPVFWRYKSVS